MGDISGEQTLSTLFNGNYFYRIPDYQRGYAWGEEQLKDFWEDLLNSKNNKHYTGVLSIEQLSKKEKDKVQYGDDKILENSKAYYVVDGQQRLTTSIILLQVILNFVKSEKFIDKELKFYKEKYIGVEKPEGKYYFFGYTFDNPSYEFLKTKIFGDESSKDTDERSIYTKNLETAYKFFIDKINNENVEAIFIALTQNFIFNVYQISSDFDVYVAFETMNNRGKPLSTLELLKNRLIYLSTKLNDDKVGESLRDIINDCWKEIYKYLGRNTKNILKDDDFLRVHWLMYFGDKGSFKDFLLKEYFTINNLLDKGKVKIDAEIIKHYAMNLKECVRHYYFLHNLDFPKYKNNNNISDEMILWLEKIQRLNFGAFEPLLVAILYKRRNDKNFDDNIFVELLKHIEIFIFLVFNILYRRSDFEEAGIYRNTHGYFKENTKLSEVSKNIKDIYRNVLDLGEFKKKVETYFREERKGYYGWKGLYYFLFEYEEYLRESNGHKSRKIEWSSFNEYKKDYTTIEHILPQTTNGVKEWETMLKNTAGIKDKRGKNRERNIYQLTHSLGNLVPLSQHINPKIGNKPFKQKVEEFKRVGSYATIEISNNSQWTKNIIEKRSKTLLDFMFERWHINDIIDFWAKTGEEQKWVEEQRQIQQDLIFPIS